MTNHIKFYSKNEKGRDFFVTDIHGYFDLLHEKLKEVAFDTSKDRLFVGGDICDRGPNSDWVLDYVNEPWFISVAGNHESLLISYVEALATGDDREIRNPYQMFYCNGGQWFFDLSENQQMKIYKSFKSLPIAIELESRSSRKIGIVHAEVPGNDWNYFKEMTNTELKWNGEAIAQWARTKYDKKNTAYVKNIDTVLVGHTPTDSGDVEFLGNVVYCDAGSFFRNKLNILEII